MFYADNHTVHFYIFLIIEYIIATLGVIVFRLAFRKTFLTLVEAGEKIHKTRTLLVGAGRAGRIIIKEVNNAAEENQTAQMYDIIGIVDDNTRLTGTRIHNIPVVGTTAK